MLAQVWPPTGLCVLQHKEKAEMVRLLRLTVNLTGCQGPKTGSGKPRRCLCSGAAGGPHICHPQRTKSG